MSKIALGLVIATVLVLLALLLPVLIPVVTVLERIGCVTVFLWALLELIRRP
jgi:hypothetical protein